MRRKDKVQAYDESVKASAEDLSQIVPGKRKVRVITKRDGFREKYSIKKIKKAVIAAYREEGKEVPSNLFRRFDYYLNKLDELTEKDSVSVEEVQDVIEYFLMKEDQDVAKRYILYRAQRKNTRDFVNKKRAWIENYKGSKNTAAATIDDNSNVGSKNIGVLNAEIHKEDNIQISRGMVMSKLKELHPDFDPKNYIRDLQHHIIYKHDESSFAGAIAPYCCSISMYPFLINGLKELGGLSAAPKNLDSYCGLYVNLIFAVAAQFAGAIATSEFLLYFDYFAKKDYGENYWNHSDEFCQIGHSVRRLQKLTDWKKVVKCIDDIRDIAQDSDVSDEARTLAQSLIDSYKDGKLEDNTRSIKSLIHQKFQQVIYSINQPAAARGLQSAFVNFSYFDKPFFDGMFGNFVFPDLSAPTWDSLNWLQKDFMRWFNAERLKTMITFPVESFALVNKNGKFLDEENARFVAEEYARGHSFFTYISDSVDSLSSCCFEGDEVIKVLENGEEYFISIRDFVNSYKTPVDQIGIQQETNVAIDAFDSNGSSKGKVAITGLLKKKYTGKMYKFEVNGKSINVTSDHVLLVKNVETDRIEEVPAEIVANDTDKYLIAIQQRRSMTFAKIDAVCISNVKDKEVYDIQLADHHYFSANDIITHNCRLKNKVTTHEFNFTNGNMGVETGSKSVITLNLSRIMQDYSESAEVSFTEDEERFYKGFKKHLVKILDRVYKYHEAYDSLLHDMLDAGLLPVYSAGFISLNKQYLTIGLNGLNQAWEFLGGRCSDNEEYKKFCQLVFGTIKAQNQKQKQFGLSPNTEMVPAESLAVKNYDWDKADGYWVPEDTNLYASYVFKPNDDTVSVLEKLRMHGSEYIGDYLDGGSAAHINLSEHLSVEQNWQILNYAASVGCQYFTFNVPNSECTECGYITKHPIDECPKCGSKNIDYYDRPIGYVTRIKNWSPGRQIEQKKRVYHDPHEILKK